MKRILAMLKNNIWLKVSALVFAVILWTFVMTQVDPYRNKPVAEIPIRYNLSDLDDKKLLLRGDPAEVFPDVEAVVSVKLSSWYDLSTNNITVSADLTSISSAGEHTLQLKSESTIGKIVSITPSTVTVDVDNLFQKEVPVTYEKTGNIAEGLVDGDVYISPSAITIYGPQRDLEPADRAVFEIDLGDVTQEINRSYNVRILDKDDNEIANTVFVVELPSVKVQMDVLHSKTVPINYDKSSLSGKVPDGYEITDIKLLPGETVEIKGTEEDLALIETLDIKPISIDGLDPENPSDLPVEIIWPEGITPVNPVQIRAKLVVEKLPEETPQATSSGTGSAIYQLR